MATGAGCRNSSGDGSRDRELSVKQIDIGALQKRLRDQGAILE